MINLEAIFPSRKFKFFKIDINIRYFKKVTFRNKFKKNENWVLNM